MTPEELFSLAKQSPGVFMLVTIAGFTALMWKLAPALSKLIETRRSRGEREFKPTQAWADKQESRAKEFHLLVQRVQTHEARIARAERMARALYEMKDEFADVRVAAEGMRSQMQATQDRMGDFCDRLARIEDRLMSSGPKTPGM